jgi:hypothetical protein
MRTASVIVCAAVAMVLAGCGSTINAENAAESVTKVVSKETKFRPTDVKCPSSVEAKVGAEFDCTFTGPDGDYTAHVRVESINGDDVDFHVQSERD